MPRGGPKERFAPGPNSGVRALATTGSKKALNGGAPIKHGRYSARMREGSSYLAAYQEVLKDPDWLSLEAEIAAARTHIDLFLGKFGQEAMAGKDLRMMLGFFETISRLVKRQHDMLINERTTLTEQQFANLILAFLNLAAHSFAEHPRWPFFLDAVYTSLRVRYASAPERGGASGVQHDPGGRGTVDRHGDTEDPGSGD